MSSSQSIAISAVIPSYNRAHLVARAITSVLNQSLLPAEIIIVDDGSTDDTEQAVRRFGDRVRYIRQENGGGARARNRGVQEAAYGWVAFLDSDDVWTRTHLESIALAIGSTKGAAAFYFDDMVLPDSPEITWWELGGFFLQADHILVPDASEWVLREYQPMMLQTTVCNREIFQEEGGLWEVLRNAHDTHFFLKIGIGRPACAVRGRGCVQTADAPGATRLTSGTMEAHRFINKTQAFRDILRTKPELTAAQRQLLNSRLATSYWTLGRFAWEDRRHRAFLANVMHAAATDLRTTARLMSHAVRERLNPNPASERTPHGA
jgi:hypothetical protein